MFQITRDDVAALNDTDLRLLVGMLAEEEVRKGGYSPSAVTYGGDQRAADGGIDVRVEMASDLEIHGYVPRPSTGSVSRKRPLTLLENRSNLEMGRRF